MSIIHCYHTGTILSKEEEVETIYQCLVCGMTWATNGVTGGLRVVQQADEPDTFGEHLPHRQVERLVKMARVRESQQ